LDETERLVATTYVEKLNGHRLALRFPVINNAAQIAFLVDGECKSAIVKERLTTEKCDYPAARIRSENGQLIWFVTQDAAGGLAI